MDDFVSRANDVLGYVMGLGVLVGVLALLIIGGRMIHANFTGDPWIAARGMSDLPWVLLGLVLLAGSGIMAGTLLQGSVHSTDTSLPDLLAESVEYQQKQEEASIPEDCLQDPETQAAVCPDDDEWDTVTETAALTGDRDPRCLQDGAADCYEYCYIVQTENPLTDSPCYSEEAVQDADWIWAKYSCPNVWNDIIAEGKEVPACEDQPPNEVIGLFDSDQQAKFRYYTCTHYEGWVEYHVTQDLWHGVVYESGPEVSVEQSGWCPG